MKKFLIVSTGMLTLGLLLGQVLFPEAPFVWMASDATPYVLLRAGIVVLLTVLAFSEVINVALPRPVLLAGATGFLSLAIAMLFGDQLPLADGVIFVETAIILSLEFLESSRRASSTLKTRPVGKLGVGNDFVKIS